MRACPTDQEDEIVGVIQLPHERISERLTQLEYEPERVAEHILEALRPRVVEGTAGCRQVDAAGTYPAGHADSGHSQTPWRTRQDDNRTTGQSEHPDALANAQDDARIPRQLDNPTPWRTRKTTAFLLSVVCRDRVVFCLRRLCRVHLMWLEAIAFFVSGVFLHSWLRP